MLVLDGWLSLIGLLKLYFDLFALILVWELILTHIISSNALFITWNVAVPNDLLLHCFKPFLLNRKRIFGISSYLSLSKRLLIEVYWGFMVVLDGLISNKIRSVDNLYVFIVDIVELLACYFISLVWLVFISNNFLRRRMRFPKVFESSLRNFFMIG